MQVFFAPASNAFSIARVRYTKSLGKPLPYLPFTTLAANLTTHRQRLESTFQPIEVASTAQRSTALLTAARLRIKVQPSR